MITDAWDLKLVIKFGNFNISWYLDWSWFFFKENVNKDLFIEEILVFYLEGNLRGLCLGSTLTFGSRLVTLILAFVGTITKALIK